MALEQLPLGKIRAAEDQPRKTFYQDSLEELAASIKERGVLEPIVVRPMKGKDGPYFQIVMGERRFRASKLAGKETIPAIVKTMTDEEAAADALLENFQREDLNPIEKAYAVRGLLQFMSYEKAARTLGISETTVRRTLELLDLPPFLQRELIERPVGAGSQTTFAEGHARILMGFNDEPETQNLLLAKIKSERISVAALEQVVEAIRKFPAKKAVFLHVAAGVTGQMARSLDTQEERKKPYKPQTAREHLKSIDKHTTTAVEVLDERVVEFLSLEEMNQLLATMERATKRMEGFAHKVREALENRDFGFREVYTHCPLCGRIELVGGKRCAVCYTILRRCTDCGHYDKTNERCGALGGPPIEQTEAEAPTDKSRSYACPEYMPKFTPQGFKLKMASLK